MCVAIWEVAEGLEHLCYGLPTFCPGLVGLVPLSSGGVLRFLFVRILAPVIMVFILIGVIVLTAATAAMAIR